MTQYANTSKHEKLTRLTPYRVELRCDQPGCKGMVVGTGHGITQGWKSNWQHRCNKCGHESHHERNYPDIEYRGPKR